MRTLKWVVILVVMLASISNLAAQTPGMIVKPAEAPGNTVLDPDGDGYVSVKINGSQIGFTDPPADDIVQSEIPYVPIVRPDPLSDLLRGPSGMFVDIVGVDETGKNAIMIYNDGNNLLFRYRIGTYAPNSKSYSILIDADQKFGFTGLTADPGAMSGNPGFEIEVVLKTNFSVDVYDVNDRNPGVQVATHLYETNCHKAMSVSNASGDPDYFYDFYVPFSDLTALGITTNTPLRFVSLTTMNPQAAIGNNAASDFGGVTSGRNIDDIFAQLVSAQTPTSINNINSDGILERSACPTINPVLMSSTTFSGTTTETSGTITVYVYNITETSLLGKATGSITGANWSVNVSALSPAVTLQEGMIVKATATGTSRGESPDNCDIELVNATCTSPISGGVVNSNADKGVKITVPGTYSVNSKVRLYKPDGTLFPDLELAVSGGSAGDSNPATVVTGDYEIEFKCRTGNCFGNELYIISIQQPNECESEPYYYCGYATGGTTATPVITTTSVSTSTTSIQGRGTAAFSVINLYVNGAYRATTRTAGDAPYAWEIPISGLSLCESITARQIIANQCMSAATAALNVSRKAATPVFNSTGCYVAMPSNIDGYSTEIGATITLSRTAPIAADLGTATVAANGEWSVTGLAGLSNGDVLISKVTSGSCVTASDASASITLAAKSTNTAIITTPVIYEGDNSLSGTGTNGDIITLYVDGSAPVKAGGGIYTTTVVGGNWNITLIAVNDLYIGGQVWVTATSPGMCEGNASTSKIVQCVNPTVPAYTAADYNYCVENAGQMPLFTSQAGVIYQMVDSAGDAVGPSILGTGSGITLFTFPLSANLLNVNVKAYKIGYNTCSSTATTRVNFFYLLPTPTVTFGSTSIEITKGTTTTDLAFSAKSASPLANDYTLAYSVAAKSQGFSDVVAKTTITAAPGTINLTIPAAPTPGSYTGIMKVHPDVAGCSRNYGITITIYDINGTPVVITQPANATICAGTNTILSVSAAGAGTINYQWQMSSSYTGIYSNVSDGSGALTATYTTANLATTKYYRVKISNLNGSIYSNVVTVTVNPQPIVLGSMSGSASVCAGQSVTYSISPIYNAISYTWSYSGSNATISPLGNSATVSFASNATSGNMSVKGNNACGSGVALTQAITINPAPFINNMTAVGCSGTAFSISPADVTNGIVPSGTTYSWAAPNVTGSVTGGALGSNQANINGTLTNPTATTQTASYTITPVKGTCTGASFTTIINLNPPISATATSVDALCNGSATGSVNLTVAGGTPGYTFDWDDDGMESPDNDLQNLSAKAAGTYSVTITDSKLCAKTTSATVGQPSVISITPTITNVTCNGGSTGVIAIAVSGGTGPYTFLWENGETTQNRSSLAAGTYTLTVKDANECSQASGNIIVTQAAAITVSTSFSTINCFGSLSTITVTAGGGTGTLNYNLNGGTYQAGNTFANVAASTSAYTITVKDANNCTSTGSVTVTQPSAIVLSTVLTQPTCPPNATIVDDENGAINLTVSGGTGAKTYDWSNDGMEAIDNDTKDISGLQAGNYSITVTDANNCTASATVTLIAVNVNPATPGTITK